MNEQVTVLFTRLKGLATVVWDPEKDRMLAHFNKRGLLATSNPKVIETLRSMGYREVTVEEIISAGLPVPTEDEVPDAMDKGPGRGYTVEGSGVEGTAMAMPMTNAGHADRAGGDGNHLFEPAPGEKPLGDAGRRKLVK